MKDLDELLDTYMVGINGEEKEWYAVNGWYSVADADGFIAHFANAKDANAFILMKINMELNS